MVELVYTRPSKRRPCGDESSNLSLATNLKRMSQCSVRPHKPDPPGATPGSATLIGYANRKSGHVEDVAILWVRPPSRSPWSVFVFRRHLASRSILVGILQSRAVAPKFGAACLMVRRLFCMQVIGVRFPGGPLAGHFRLLQRHGMHCWHSML